MNVGEAYSPTELAAWFIPLRKKELVVRAAARYARSLVLGAFYLLAQSVCGPNRYAKLFRQVSERDAVLVAHPSEGARVQAGIGSPIRDRSNWATAPTC